VGLGGSPTKVLNVNYLVLEASRTKEFTASDEGVVDLIRELVQDYTL
jgi:hypothetical protein